jgi:SAM-dependent MidA family methyltransferase
MTHDRPGPTPGYRRESLLDPGDIGEDAVLVARIRGEVEDGGPITFARFMERALYEPELGYYRRPAPGPGREGDFLTAPEADPIFGAAVGRLLEQAWEGLGRPDPFTVTEPGAGTGALAAGLLGGLRDAASPMLAAIRYRPVEVEPARIAAFHARLEHDGFGGHLLLTPPDGEETGAVVANEVLDALPVHRVTARAGRLRERYVSLGPDGAFTEVDGDPSTPALAARLAREGIVLAEGQVAEVCLVLDAWLAGATAHLGRGVVVLVDYGEAAAELYRDRPERHDGTLRSFARHAVGGDPFRAIGRQDLTAHVDLTAVADAAAAAALTPLGATTQAELLVSVGAGALVAARLNRPGASLQEAFALRSALARLMNPRGMGGFRVLAFGRGLAPGTELPGLRPVPRPGEAAEPRDGAR